MLRNRIFYFFKVCKAEFTLNSNGILFLGHKFFIANMDNFFNVHILNLSLIQESIIFFVRIHKKWDFFIFSSKTSNAFFSKLVFCVCKPLKKLGRHVICLNWDLTVQWVLYFLFSTLFFSMLEEGENCPNKNLCKNDGERFSPQCHLIPESKKRFGN